MPVDILLSTKFGNVHTAIPTIVYIPEVVSRFFSFILSYIFIIYAIVSET